MRLNQIAQTELVAKVPAHTENNHFPIKMPTIEHPLQTFLLAQTGHQIDWIATFTDPMPPICIRASSRNLKRSNTLYQPMSLLAH